MTRIITEKKVSLVNEPQDGPENPAFGRVLVLAREQCLKLKL